ncbi:hypothetical protein V1264_002142 [Littorina saxatilis]
MSDANKIKLGTDEKQERLIWIDLEMTGLDVETDEIIEIACLVSTGSLDVVVEGPNIVIHQPKEVMDRMEEWCIQHHGQSGLTKAVLESKISTSDAEQKVLSFLQQHTVAGKAPLAGNSVFMDKAFLQKYMPSLVNHMHYRIVDVSTVKELCRSWYPDEFQKGPQKDCNHRALDDIRESIKELQYYRQAIFKSTAS